MSQYIPIICFVVGVLTGGGMITAGFVLGFRASYEIRNNSDSEGKGIIKHPKDPAEFDLLDKEEA